MLTYAIAGWLILNDIITITSTEVSRGTYGTWISGIASVLLLAILIVNGIRLTQTEFGYAQYRAQFTLKELLEERSVLEQRVSERTSAIDKRTTLLKAVADVGKAITSFRNLSELLQQTTYLIRENFGYYHVGIFLLDDRKEYAVLSATNSEGGQRMLERKHQLKVGETGIVGYVTEYAKARIALDVGKDAVYFDNPDLPETRSEMALPHRGGRTDPRRTWMCRAQKRRHSPRRIALPCKFWQNSWQLPSKTRIYSMKSKKLWKPLV